MAKQQVQQKDGRFLAGSQHLAVRLGTQVSGIASAFAKAVVGKKIVGVGYDIDGFEGFPFLVLNDGTTLTIARDDEVNGPGVVIAVDPAGKAESRLCQVSP